MEDAYARSVTEVLNFFRMDPTKGLTDFQVAEHGRIYGRNVLPQEGRTPFWKLVLKQFDDLLVKILIAAAIISFLLALVNGETGLTAFLDPSLMFDLPLLRGSYGGFFTQIVGLSFRTVNCCSTRETAYPCSIFNDRHPSTVSMTVLVVVEMFNALNNLSENQSLCDIPPWSNMWLIASIIITMLHVLILYVKPLSILFSVTPLTWAEWTVVLYLSFPVIIIDEILKFFSRNSIGAILCCNK